MGHTGAMDAETLSPFALCAAARAPMVRSRSMALTRAAAYEGRGTTCCRPSGYEGLGEVCLRANCTSQGVTLDFEEKPHTLVQVALPLWC